MLARVREWNRKVPEIHIGGDPRNPVIRVQLSDVDYESVVENAKGEDNEGRRRELLKDLVREAIGITERDPDVFGVYAHPVIWRGSRRGVDVVFGNVRDAGWLTEDHFRNRPRHLAVRDRLPVRRGGALGGRGPGPGRPAGRGRAEGADHRVAAPVPVRGPDARRAAPGHPGLAAQRDRRALDQQCRPPVRGGPGAGQGHPGKPAHGPAGGAAPAVQECYGAAAPTPGTLVEDSAHDRVLVSRWIRASPPPRRSARTWPRPSAIWSTRRSARPTRGIRGSSRPTSRSPCGTWRRSYAHVERAVADPERRVRLEGDIAAVRRVANPLGVGMAAETHFLFGDDRFPWGAEFERAAARDGVAAPGPGTVGQLRGWLAAIRPELGLRDEVGDLIVMAWAALRQRAWYHHGSSIPAPRPGAARADMQLRTEPLPVPADWEAARSRAEVLFGIKANPHLTAAAVTEFTETVLARLEVAADPAAGLVQRVNSRTGTRRWLPTPPADWRPLAPGRPSSSHLRRTGGRVPPGAGPGAGRAAGDTDTAVANSLSRAPGRRLGGRRVPVGPARPSARRRTPGRRAGPGGRAHAGQAAGGGRGRRVRDPARPGPVGNRRRHLRLAVHRAAAAPPATLPIHVAAACGPVGAGHPGQGRRPASEVLGPLQAFLDAHRDDEVEVEWRVHE